MRSLALLSIALCTLLGGMQAAPDRFRLETDEAQGATVVLEADRPVLAYRFSDQLPAELDGQYVRACYIHPLFSLEGRPITDDFPADHPHHHGLSWTWPRIRVGERAVQTWHPSPLRQHFTGWAKREADDQGAVLSADAEWRIGAEVVATENLTLHVHRAGDAGRVIDLALVITAGDEPIELLGAEEKGYGGLMFRGSEAFKGARMRTDRGPLEEDSLNRAYRWADLSAADAGLSIFVPEDHPGGVPDWMIRNSYAGILNVAWPGLAPRTIAPGEALTLRYRLFVHDGTATEQELARRYEEYRRERGDDAQRATTMGTASDGAGAPSASSDGSPR